MKWHSQFSTERHSQSNALIRVKFPGLSMEFWEPRTLMPLGSAIGRPIHIGNTTVARDNSYYAMVISDVDLSIEHPDKI